MQCFDLKCSAGLVLGLIGVNRRFGGGGIILTAKTDAMQWGGDIASCVGFMTKPFENRKLLSEVKRLLKTG
jgi:hypothetical protein